MCWTRGHTSRDLRAVREWRILSPVSSAPEYLYSSSASEGMWIRGGCGSNIELWVSQVLSLLSSLTLFHQSLHTVWDLDIPMWICSGHVFSSMFKVTPIICPPREHPFLLYPTSARSWGIFTRICFYSYSILLHHSILTSQCLKANQILMVNKMVSIMIYVFIHTHTQIWHL